MEPKYNPFRHNRWPRPLIAITNDCVQRAGKCLRHASRFRFWSRGDLSDLTLLGAAMHLYIAVGCRTPHCGRVHILLHLGEKDKEPKGIEYWIPHPLLIECPGCGRIFDYSDSEEQFFQQELPKAPPAGYSDKLPSPGRETNQPRIEADFRGPEILEAGLITKLTRLFQSRRGWFRRSFVGHLCPAVCDISMEISQSTAFTPASAEMHWQCETRQVAPSRGAWGSINIS